MDFLSLYLSPLEGDTSHFKLIAKDSTGSAADLVSLLPFDGDPGRLTTVLKVLDAVTFRSSDYPGDRELDWMVQNRLLHEGRSAFEPQMRERIGQALFQSLFPAGKESKELLLSALRLAQVRSTQLHIQLEMAADSSQRSRLAEYPWELLHDGQDFLAHERVAFSRYISYNAAAPNMPAAETLNVLLVCSAAADPLHGLEPLGQEELEAICLALKEAEKEGTVRLARLHPAKLDQLRDYLTSHRGNQAPHVIHFDGHGVYQRRCNNTPSSGVPCHTMHGVSEQACRSCGAPLPEPQGYLLFLRDDGGPDYVSAREFGTLINEYSCRDAAGRLQEPALVVLSACRSGLSLAGDSVFHGVAQSLIKHRVPAVVAMLFQVSAAGAAAFSTRFYSSLAQRDPLVTAANRGREAMGSESNQWYRPVLYLRWQDNEGGQLFSPTSSVEDGIRTLKDLMQTPQIKEAVSHFQADFVSARDQIDILSYYKDLHDQLHALQMECYNRAAQEVRNFPDDEITTEDLFDCDLKLDDIVSALKDIARTAPPSTQPTSWIQRFIQDLADAHEQMHQALDTRDTEQLRSALSCVDRVLRFCPTRINACLLVAAPTLKLPSLAMAMTSIRESLAPYGAVSGAPVKELDKGIAALIELESRLIALIKEHDVWQGVDLDLRQMEDSVKQDVSELRLSWPRVKAQAGPLYMTNTGEWAIKLKADAENLEGAVAAQDPARIKQSFRAYRKRAADRFFRVDKELKSLCDNLRTVGSELDSILTVMA